MSDASPVPLVLLVLSVLASVIFTQDVPPKDNVAKPLEEISPSVVVALLVRNKAYALPYVLGALERQDYPMERVSLWIHEDRSVDDSARLLQEWRRQHLSRAAPLFHSIHLETGPELAVGGTASDDFSVPEWTTDRFEHVMHLRQQALNFSRRFWADRVFMLDADVVLSNPAALRQLMEGSALVTVVAPLLNCTGGGVNAASYANFWGAMDEEGYYLRSEDYFQIKQREKVGIFAVPMVHTALLINLRRSDSNKVDFARPVASEKYSGPIDDIIVFALRAQKRGLKLHVDNRIFFGYFTEPLAGYYFYNEQEYFRHLLLEAMLDQADVSLNRGVLNDTGALNVAVPAPSVSLGANWTTPPASHRYGFERIYLINLARRVDRRRKMEESFKLLGIEAEYVEAVDSNQLNASYLTSLGVRQMPGYSDPFYRRGLKLGEVGCFLSHMRIWEKVAHDPTLKQVVIFEDDIRFNALFDSILYGALSELERLQPDWELLYLGRKILLNNETMLPKAKHLALPQYTYWTLSYAISKKGAQKLLAQQPLTRMVAVDEFLPIMFDQHPNNEWKAHFGPRDLKALTLAPLIVQPTHYVGEKHYFSDTEASVVLCNDNEGADHAAAAAAGTSLELCGVSKSSLQGSHSDEAVVPDVSTKVQDEL